jgi:predicted membrane channel-forming protein YqfA (hemolysin III family)
MPLDDCTLERMKCAAELRQHSAGGQPQPAVAEHPGPRISFRLGEVLRDRDFRLLWSGEFVSLLGDQFFTVALPWLVLQLTGNALAIGTVLAVTAAPRAVFILLGGVLIDRFSPRTVMLYSNLGRMVLVAVLAFITAAGLVQLWMLYAFGLLLGLGTAFYLPAQSAMIPRLVPDERLQTGNALIQGTAQLSLALGPVAAGVLIAFLGRHGTGAATVPGASGISIALGFDAATFLVSAITLALIALPPLVHDEARDAGNNGVFRSLAQGIADVWRDRTLRHYFVLIGAVNLALLGPLSVGIPILAHTRLSGGALAYGAVLSGLGAGALAGVVAGGALRRPAGRGFAGAMLGSVVLLGVGLSLLGVFTSTGPATAAAFVIGAAEGYLIVEFITWLQLRTPRDELGRTMSILLFVSAGMAPVSNLIAGALIGLSVSAVMIGAGSLIVLVAAIAAFSPSVWRLSENGARPA